MIALSPYIDPHGLLVVVGGTAVAMAIRAPVEDLLRALRALGTLGRRPFDGDALVEQVRSLDRIALRNGVVALDRSRAPDPDVAAAVAAIVDGDGPATVTRLLEDRSDTRVERHLAAADTWAAVAEIAPAMGMVGTLIGLVRMFMAMTDPATIGTAMATALTSTLYGALLAALVAMPIAGRLRRLARAEAMGRARVVAPLAALARRERPQFREAAE